MTDSTKIYIQQNEYVVDDRPEVCIATLLGSCVACCIWDETTGTGGMNHLLLPPDTSTALDASSVHLMELLVNGLLKKGARKSRLEAKIFGGAKMIEGLSNAGARNAAFVQEFLAHEGIPCVTASVGGTQGRRIEFWPVGGRARQKLVARDTIREPTQTEIGSSGNDVELF